MLRWTVIHILMIVLHVSQKKLLISTRYMTTHRQISSYGISRKEGIVSNQVHTGGGCYQL